MTWALRYWRPLLAAVIVAGLWGHGYRTGRAGCEAAHVAAEAKALREAAEASQARAAAENRARLLARELEDAAYAEPPVAAACLPRARVLRLDAR